MVGKTIFPLQNPREARRRGHPEGSGSRRQRSKLLMIGRQILQFKVLEELGRGGMGVVYKAQDLKLDRFVALKFLSPQLGEDEEDKTRFVREAKAASTLDHPNICTIHEIDESENGQLFIVMAYYDGETLKKKIERGLLNLEEANYFLIVFFTTSISRTWMTTLILEKIFLL